MIYKLASALILEYFLRSTTFATSVCALQATAGAEEGHRELQARDQRGPTSQSAVGRPSRRRQIQLLQLHQLNIPWQYDMPGHRWDRRQERDQSGTSIGSILVRKNNCRTKD